jgi:hypothetical protein
MSRLEAPRHALFEWVHHLEKVLKPYPEVALVLSSSWCVYPGFGDTMKRFPVDLRSRFIGGTFHSRVHGRDPWALERFRDLPRGAQVWADVQRRKPLQWLALDDDLAGWPKCAAHRLVACHGSNGISDPRIQLELLTRLAHCHAALIGPRIAEVNISRRDT